eukprot:2073856-Rhodomonas_salina.1
MACPHPPQTPAGRAARLGQGKEIQFQTRRSVPISQDPRAIQDFGIDEGVCGTDAAGPVLSVARALELGVREHRDPVTVARDDNHDQKKEQHPEVEGGGSLLEAPRVQRVLHHLQRMRERIRHDVQIPV